MLADSVSAVQIIGGRYENTEKEKDTRPLVEEMYFPEHVKIVTLFVIYLFYNLSLH